MMRFLFSGRQALGCLTLLALSAGAWAERPDPLDAEAATPALVYQSPLSSYQGLRDEPRQDWRAANAQVGRIGGWRSYALEAWEVSESEGGAPADESVPSPHADHGH